MELVYAAFLLCAEILIGFNTKSISLTSPESNGTVALVVNVFNITIGEGITVQVRITTADNSAQGIGNSVNCMFTIKVNFVLFVCSFIGLQSHFRSFNFL